MVMQSRKTARQYQKEAISLCNQGNFAKALEIANEALALNPTTALYQRFSQWGFSLLSLDNIRSYLENVKRKLQQDSKLQSATLSANPIPLVASTMFSSVSKTPVPKVSVSEKKAERMAADFQESSVSSQYKIL
jgi:Flp pilus assembly protein TadD